MRKNYRYATYMHADYAIITAPQYDDWRTGPTAVVNSKFCFTPFVANRDPATHIFPKFVFVAYTVAVPFQEH